MLKPEVKAPEILLRERSCLIINKPAGLPVHAGRAGGASVEDFFGGWRQGKNGPWLAHRLDQDTAGCLVIALKKSFLLEAQALFAGGMVEKTYWAVVAGVPGAAAGVIEAPLTKQTQNRAWKMVVDQAGQSAVTAWRVLGSQGDISVIQFTPKTGRTHQIRAHAGHFGHPILGDSVYGGRAGALQLLARSIVLPGELGLQATAPVPAHMRAAVEACGGAL